LKKNGFFSTLTTTTNFLQLSTIVLNSSKHGGLHYFFGENQHQQFA